MQPQIIRYDDLAAAVNAKMLRDLACAEIEKTFDLKGCANPVWGIAHGPRIMWLATNWDNDNEKYASVAVVRALLEMLDAQAYCFLCEAWTASTVGLDEQEAMALLDFTSRFGVNALPPNRRDDVVFINAQDRDGKSYSSRYLVTVRQRGPNMLGPRVDEQDEAVESKGLLVNLYNQRTNQ
jgi:hypothetical protein